MRKIAIYARLSVKDHHRTVSGSIENQIESIQRWVKGENSKHDVMWGEVVGVYQDEDYSGETLKRPDATRLLNDINSGKVDTVIMTEISRLSRSVRDWIHLRDYFNEKNAAFIATRQSFDTTTAMGRSMLGFAIEFAQLEREQTAERVMASIYARGMRGLWTGGPIPFGLKATGRPGHLEIDEAMRKIAEDVFSTFLYEGGSLQATLDKIPRERIPKDNQFFQNRQSLANWLRSHALIGKVEVNAKSKSKDQASLPEREKYFVLKAEWPALIDETTWQKANALLAQNYRSLKVPQWKGHEFLFSGLLECPHGERLTGTSGKGRGGAKFIYYRHASHGPRQCACGIRNLKTDVVDAHLLQELRRFASASSLVEEMTLRANLKLSKERPDFRKILQNFQRRRDGIENKLEKTTDVILETENVEHRRILLDKASALRREDDILAREIESTRLKMSAFGPEALNRQDIIDAIAVFHAEFNVLSMGTKQAYIRAIVEKAVIHEDRWVLHVKSPPAPQPA